MSNKDLNFFHEINNALAMQSSVTECIRRKMGEYFNIEDKNLYTENYLRREIIIYYKDDEWRDTIFKDIIDMVPAKAIGRIFNNKNNMSIKFVDQSRLKMVKASEYARGQKAHEIYMQDGIDENIYNNVIEPSLVLNRGREIIVINNVKDMLWGHGYNWGQYS